MNLDDLIGSLLERVDSPIDGAAIVDSDEAGEWPDGTLAELLRRGVLAPAQPGSAVTCDGCWDDHVEEVEFVEWPPGAPLRLYVACPYVGRVPVDPARLRQWEIVSVGPAVRGHGAPIRTTSESPAARPDQDDDDDAAGGFRASEDYRSVTMGGETYPLTEAPALVVRMLNEAFEHRTPDVTWARIQMALIEQGFQAPRMVDVFRRVRGWKGLIISRKRGSYRLNRRSD